MGGFLKESAGRWTDGKIGRGERRKGGDHG